MVCCRKTIVSRTSLSALLLLLLMAGDATAQTGNHSLPSAAGHETVAPPPASATGASSSSALLTSPAVGTNSTPITPTSLSSYVPDDKYRLRVGDRVGLQILEDRDLPRRLIIADSGELKALLEKEDYYRATVIIALDAANKFLGRIYVSGQVKNQGPIDIAVNENLTAGKAILRAGGFADFANKKKVKLVRGAGPDGVGKQNFELNMVDILENGKTEKDVLLQPDDFIIVPSRLINF